MRGRWPELALAGLTLLLLGLTARAVHWDFDAIAIASTREDRLGAVR